MVTRRDSDDANKPAGTGKQQPGMVSSVAVANLPWVFTQNHPLKTSEFISGLLVDQQPRAGIAAAYQQRAAARGVEPGQQEGSPIHRWDGTVPPPPQHQMRPFQHALPIFYAGSSLLQQTSPPQSLAIWESPCVG